MVLRFWYKSSWYTLLYLVLQVIVCDPFFCRNFACSINSGAYVAEIIRAGIQSIDKGQMEAGRSLRYVLGTNYALYYYAASI